MNAVPILGTHPLSSTNHARPRLTFLGLSPLHLRIRSMRTLSQNSQLFVVYLFLSGERVKNLVDCWFLPPKSPTHPILNCVLLSSFGRAI